MADGAYVVFIATPFSTDADFFAALAHALPEDCSTARGSRPRAFYNGVTARGPFRRLPPAEVRLRAAVFAPHEEILLYGCARPHCHRGRLPLPAGHSLVMPGEIITPESTEFFEILWLFTIKVLK